MSSLISLLPVVDNPHADFSDTPGWLSLVKALLVFVFLLVNTLVVIWFERRVIGLRVEDGHADHPGSLTYRHPPTFWW